MDWELIWNDIYVKQGEVQHDVLPTIEMIADLFQEENVKTVSFCDDQNNTHHIEALLVVCRK